MPAYVRVVIGPVPGRSARAWLAAAQRTIDTVRNRPALGVPEDVVDGFDLYLTLWGAAMQGNEFRWEGDVDPALLRHLAAHWARLATLARDESADAGLAPADPEGEAFFAALAAGMADALGRADDAEAFAAKFEEVVPAFDSTTGGSGSDAPAATVRVLLVDDNPDIRLLVRIGLESSGGFSVVGEACDGREAVEEVAALCPEAVLLDLSMPVMDGFEALPLIRQRCPGARVVVFSANDGGAVRERVLAEGAVAFLRKDAAIADVAAALRGGDG